jgi:tetratricopeptide (TPR) repeat protein
MKRFLTAMILGVTLLAQAAAPPRGDDRLRELAIFPDINVTLYMSLDFEGNKSVIHDNANLDDKISSLREALKQHPDDIKRLLQLANALDSSGKTNQSPPFYQKAEQLCRSKLAVNPQDGFTLMDLGEALHEQRRDDEAESKYRHAVLVSSNEWSCWVGLGNFLKTKCETDWYPSNLEGQFFQGLLPTQAALDYRPAPDVLLKSEAESEEAAHCFDRALTLGPGESEIYIQHAGYDCTSNWLSCLFRHYRDNEKIDPTAFYLARFSKETIADLEKASELNPKNYNCIGLAADFEWMNAAVSAKSANPTLDSLPDDARKLIHDAMSRLENLSNDPDKEIATGALENLGMLHAMSGDYPAALAESQRAVSLDPQNDAVWDLRLAMMTKSASREEEETVCESRLNYKNSARNRLLLAKIFQYGQKWSKAQEQCEMALQLEPDNFSWAIIARNELLALDLKQSNNPDFLSKAAGQIASTGPFLNKVSNPTEYWASWRILTLNQAIYNALTHSPDSRESAKACLELVLKYYPNDPQAKQISEALN